MTRAGADLGVVRDERPLDLFVRGPTQPSGRTRVQAGGEAVSDCRLSVAEEGRFSRGRRDGRFGRGLLGAWTVDDRDAEYHDRDADDCGRPGSWPWMASMTTATAGTRNVQA